MFISSVRLGFACNSSSYHSILIVDNPDSMSEIDPEDHNYYGWGQFRLTEKESKLQYLAASMYSNLCNNLSTRYSKLVIDGILGIDSNTSGIDHQSEILIPYNFQKTELLQEYIDALVAVIEADNVVICGGNDNEDAEPVAYGREILKNIPKDFEPGYVGRYDKQFNFFTFFNGKNGTKIRLRIEDGQPITKASNPELVDMKITDFCPFGCVFCYQNSSTNGRHASLVDISAIIHQLAKREVFEIALGGGEPTLHPNFSEIINTIYNVGIVPNFTTKNITYLKTIDPSILNKVGTIAISVSNRAEFLNAIKVITAHMKQYTYQNKFSIQIIDGICEDVNHIIDVSSSLEIPLTVLGYKKVGRATDNQYFEWRSDALFTALNKVIKSGRSIRLGADVEFCKRHEQKLEQMKISPILYDTTEGSFSCYIDAVDKKIGQSSYTTELHDFKHVRDALDQHFPFV